MQLCVVISDKEMAAIRSKLAADTTRELKGILGNGNANSKTKTGGRDSRKRLHAR